MSLGQDQARGSKNNFSGNSEKVVVMGAGPAGLSAAYQLVKKGYRPTVLEKADKPGGISRTEEYKGFRFDIGGHRFLTEMAEIQEIWEDFLGDDFIRTARRSSIRYGDRVYRYPLDFSDLLKNLDVMEGLSVTASYVLARLNPFKREKNLEEWMINRFGTRLYGTFFKPYTEKLWGLPCSKIQVEWAIQRIGRLSLRKAVLHSLSGKNPARTQTNHFYYPVSGPGLLWQKMVQWIGEKGGELRYDSGVFQVNHAENRVTSIDANDGRGGAQNIAADFFINTIPVPILVRALKPAVEQRVLDAANQLNHRDLIIVNLIIARMDLFPDQWLYIHRPGIRTGRIQNYKNWSPAMVPDPAKTGIGMEYFCTKGDDLWQMEDSVLQNLAVRELDHLGIAKPSEIEDGFVVRQRYAYPVYDAGYHKNLKTVTDYLATLKNLQTIGRNGMHRYNNMDHSMMAGISAARNIPEKSANSENAISVGRDMESSGINHPANPFERILLNTFAKIDKTAFGTATGTVAGGVLFTVTIWTLLVTAGTTILNIDLLGQYLYGYSVSVSGAFLGLIYGFITGFCMGWLFAAFRNVFFGFYLYSVKSKVRRISFREFLELL